MSSWYRRVFHLREIEVSRSLQYLYWALLSAFVFDFHEWYWINPIANYNFNRGEYQCPYYFQNCGFFFFLEREPNGRGYSYGFFFALVLMAMTGSAVAAVQKRWTLAHALLIPPFVVKFVFTILFNMELVTAWEYYHLPFVFAFLFMPGKLAVCRVLITSLYFLSATVKHDQAWIAGTYFSPLHNGMPLIPDGLIPLATNAVILFETIAPWFLWTRWRKTALGLWLGFHFYSVVLVGFKYPLHCVPLLLALFASDEDKLEIPSLRMISSWVFVGFFFFLQGFRMFISGEDFPYTMEGRGLGVSMFEANYQCVIRGKIFDKKNEFKREVIFGSGSSTNRCAPYSMWFVGHQKCKRATGIGRTEWSMDKSVNGGPFYRIVDAQDACTVEYKPFSHNDWILTPGTGAKKVGYPAHNHIGFYEEVLRDDEAAGLIHEVQIIDHHQNQEFFIRNEAFFSWMWRALWLATLAFVLTRIALRKGRRKRG